jgi:hypothetical protein
MCRYCLTQLSGDSLVRVANPFEHIAGPTARKGGHGPVVSFDRGEFSAE